MKKIFVLLLGFIPMFLFAGVIMTTHDERIADVSIQSENDSTIIYLQNGVKKSISIEQVSGILYDNGKYREFVSKFIAPDNLIEDENEKSAAVSATQHAKSEQQRKEEMQYKECQKNAKKLFNKKFQEVYSQCIKEGKTQEDAKIKAREEANFVKNQSLKECMGVAE